MTAQSIRSLRPAGRRHSRARRSTLHRLACLIVSCALLVWAGAPAYADGGGRLTGRVVDAAGRPAAGAEVTVRARQGATERHQITDATGGFTFDDLPPGAYLAEARLGRGTRSAAGSIEVDAAHHADLELRLDRAAYEEQVVVTAEARSQPLDEVGKAIAIVDSDEIASRGEYSVAEALRAVAGVQVRLDGSPGQLASLRIRGLRADATAVLIDGLRFRDVATTQGDASPFISNLNVINLERAEVLRGSASSLYGTNAVGGAVNLVSRVGASAPGGELEVEGGQLGLTRARGTFNGSAREGRVGYSVGALQLNVANGVDGHDRSRSTGAQVAARAQVRSGTTVWGRLWASSDRVDLNSSPSAFATPVANLGSGPIVVARPLDPAHTARLEEQGAVDFGAATLVPGIDDPDDERTSSFWTGALRLTHQTRAGVSIDTQYQRLRGRRRFVNRPGGSGFQPLVDSRTDFMGTADTWQVLATKETGAKVVVSGGYEFEREVYTGRQQEQPGVAGAFDVGTRASQDAHALMARASVVPASRIHVAASMRVQAFRLASPSFSPAGTASAYDGVVFDAPPTAVTGDIALSSIVGTRNTKLRVHAGNAYRAPSLYERVGGGFSANPSSGVVSFTAYGDPRLEPDRYVSMDAGVDQPLGRRARIAATWFRTWVQQVTEFDFSGVVNPATDPYGRFAGYINGGGGLSHGLELEGGWRARSLRVSSAYTWTDSRTDDALLAPGFHRTPAVARHTLAVTAIEQVGDRLEIVADVFARSSTFAAFYTQLGPRAYQFPAMAKVDLGAAWVWRLDGHRRLRAHAKVDNLFDRRYYELGWLAPGATFTGGLTVQY